jgi:prepilin-type N-terminal cleavage/methylation domain-containing protein
MKRAGFTMIELIFVIVILGILAAVAIPKLTATRDDAKLSKAASDIATLVSDFGAYYTAKGQFKGAKITDITNVPLTETTAISSAGTGEYQYSLDGGTTNCIKITTTNTGGLTLAAATADADTTATCKKVKDLDTITFHNFGGTGVTY